MSNQKKKLTHDWTNELQCGGKKKRGKNGKLGTAMKAKIVTKKAVQITPFQMVLWQKACSFTTFSITHNYCR